MAGEIALDVDGDLALDDTGTLYQVEGLASITQQIRTRLLFILGTYFGDLRQGIPYFQEILIKGGDPGRVRQIIRATIMTVPGVVDVPELDLDLDSATRVLTITFMARADVNGVRTDLYSDLVL